MGDAIAGIRITDLIAPNVFTCGQGVGRDTNRDFASQQESR